MPEAHFPVPTLSLQATLTQSVFHCLSWAQKAHSGQGDSVDYGIGFWREYAHGVVCLSVNQAKYHNCFRALDSKDLIITAFYGIYYLAIY